MSLTCFLCVLNLLGAQGGALPSSLSAITVGQTVLDMAMKGVGQAISIHDKTLVKMAVAVAVMMEMAVAVAVAVAVRVEMVVAVAVMVTVGITFVL